MAAYSSGGRLLTFWAFRLEAYLRCALVRRWAVNRINTGNSQKWSRSLTGVLN